MTRHSSTLNDAQLEVLNTIERDLNSYLARDKSEWETCWLHSPEFQSIMECGTLQVASGYDAFRANIFAAMDAEPAGIRAKISRENLQIHVAENYAWATFEQLVTEIDTPHALGNLSHNFRLLTRTKAGWRVVFHGVWAQAQRDVRSPSIEVTRDCEVVWMNEAALTRLRNFPGLQVSQGTLRASRPGWDKTLRDQVCRAHELTTFATYNRAASEGGGSVTFPVVLGEDGAGALLACWVKVADGRVYVLFGQTPNLDRQVEAAQIVHGLSETQARITNLVACGLDLDEIARTLGVTRNTVKTHLKRVFEKVCVNSQVELMRKLVSFTVD